MPLQAVLHAQITQAKAIEELLTNAGQSQESKELIEEQNFKLNEMGAEHRELEQRHYDL